MVSINNSYRMDVRVRVHRMRDRRKSSGWWIVMIDIEVYVLVVRTICYWLCSHLLCAQVVATMMPHR
ncbi:hypothetical protein RhiirC2_395840 [Rhizophagus irregularis]|uniref:Uncharacterized protein n=1 Tax=Rhizophagus irregularis TaxID=588596 RepID=A0A2N1NDY4_9GLOM|nr:hypothetical protein RhiirC2_395840 [Rhizophagus irregularis]